MSLKFNRRRRIMSATLAAVVFLSMTGGEN